MRMRRLWQWTVASKSLKNVHKGKFRSENDIHFPAVYGVLTMRSVSYTVQLRMVGLLTIDSKEYWRKLSRPNRIYYPEIRRRKGWSKGSEDLISKSIFELDTTDYKAQSLPLWPDYTKEYYRIKVDKISLHEVLMPHISSSSEIWESMMLWEFP